jgi:hypothetical protein
MNLSKTNSTSGMSHIPLVKNLVISHERGNKLNEDWIAREQYIHEMFKK